MKNDPPPFFLHAFSKKMCGTLTDIPVKNKRPVLTVPLTTLGKQLALFVNDNNYLIRVYMRIKQISLTRRHVVITS